MDLRTGQVWWSPDMFELHGLPVTADVPQDYQQLVHPDDRDRVLAQTQEARRSCENQSLQYRVVWPDGSVHWLEGFGTTACDDAGRPEVMIGMCLGIDARKEEENHLQFIARAGAELAALSDYAETMRRIARLAVPHFADWCAVDVVAGEGLLERVAVAHVDEDKVRLAHDLPERYPPDPAAPGGAWNVIRTGKPELVPVITPEMLASSIRDAEYLQAIQSLGLHSYMGVPLDSGGKVRGVISFITSDSRRVFTQRTLSQACDLAARAGVAIRNAELVAALRESDASKDILLATLAHELRNPLAPIVNTIGLLARTGEPERVLPGALEVMQRQTTHLTRLVDDLLDLARINSGKIELRHDLLDLREVLRTAVETSQPLIDSRAHSLAMVLPGESIGVNGDPIRLAQVFSNLLNNAAKYTDPGGRIALQLQADADTVRVTVRDTGLGISADLLPRVFELFTQASHESRSSMAWASACTW